MFALLLALVEKFCRVTTFAKHAKQTQV